MAEDETQPKASFKRIIARYKGPPVLRVTLFQIPEHATGRQIFPRLDMMRR